MNNMTIGLSLKKHNKWDKIHLNKEIFNSYNKDTQKGRHII